MARVALVVRQLLDVVDRAASLAMVEQGTSLDDVMLLAWLRQDGSLKCSRLADRLRRPRQNVQRSLERLESRGLVERIDHREQTVGWTLTRRGEETFERADRWFGVQERALDSNGVKPEEFVKWLRMYMQVVLDVARQRTQFGLEVPPRKNEVDEWDQ
jgi:DNA-binding MarR family transcriptional regulator